MIEPGEGFVASEQHTTTRLLDTDSLTSESFKLKTDRCLVLSKLTGSRLRKGVKIKEGKYVRF